MSIFSFEIKKSTSPIIHVEVLIDDGDMEEGSNLKLIVIHEDGEVRCFSEKLERELWSARISGSTGDSTATDVQIEKACIMRLDQAQKALLRGREDILATSALEEQHNPMDVLALFTRHSVGKDRSLSLIVMKIRGPGSHEQALNISRDKPLQEIVRTIIPEPRRMKKVANRLSFHPASGALYQSSPDCLLVYDLSGMMARLAHDIELNLDDIGDCLPIAPALVMVSTASTISIADIKYSSILAQCSLAKIPLAGSSISLKKRQQHDVAPPNVQLLSYFVSRDIVVARQGRRLIGLQLTTSTLRGNGSRKRRHDILLNDSIGRGSLSARKMRKLNPFVQKGPYSFGRPLAQAPVDDAWEEYRILLDQCFAQGKYDEIERILDTEFRAAKSGQKCGRKANGTTMSENSARIGPERRKVDYLLSKLFSVQDDYPYPASHLRSSERMLRLSNLPHRICCWLIQQYYLSTETVEAALRHEGRLAANERLRSGAVFEALAQQDPSLETTLLLLHSLAPLTALEVVSALRHSIALTAESSSVKLITDGHTPNSHSSDVDLETGSQSAELQDSHALSNVQTKRSRVIHEVLLTSMKRLYHFSPHTVSKALKLAFSRSELHSLVDLLRMELSGNGWLSSYFDGRLHSSSEGRADATQVSIIAHVLNCVIDSIGSGGWISRNSLADDFTEAAETIAHMKIEISAALEGIMEATYLKGMLGEMLLCGKSFGSIESRTQNHPTSKLPVHRKSSDIVPMGLKKENVLPLGLKPSQTISTHKVGAGGEIIKRSARDLGRLKSKMVPKYSVERILI